MTKFKAEFDEQGDLQISESEDGTIFDGWRESRKDALKSYKRELQQELNEQIDYLSGIRESIVVLEEELGKL